MAFVGYLDSRTSLTTGADSDGNLHVVVHHGLRNSPVSLQRNYGGPPSATACPDDGTAMRCAGWNAAV